MAQVSARPQPYVSPHHPLLHRGVVEVTGQKTVDLGIGHNNFTPSLNIKGGISALAPAHIVAWDYGSKPGTFVITVGKATGAGDTTVILATATVNVSFTVIAGASAE